MESRRLIMPNKVEFKLTKTTKPPFVQHDHARGTNPDLTEHIIFS